MILPCPSVAFAKEGLFSLYSLLIFSTKSEVNFYEVKINTICEYRIHRRALHKHNHIIIQLPNRAIYYVDNLVFCTNNHTHILAYFDGKCNEESKISVDVYFMKYLLQRLEPSFLRTPPATIDTSSLWSVFSL